MSSTDVKFGEWIQQGFDLYKANIGVLLLATLIAVALSSLTVGVLAGPMCAGLALITLALLDGRQPKPQAGDVFQGFSYFLPSFVFYFGMMVVVFLANVVLAFLPCIGSILGLLVTFVVHALTMFTIFLIVDRKLDVTAALQASFDVVKANFWPFLGLNVVAAIIGSLGGLLCGIGMILTLPIYFCVLAVAYRNVFSTVASAPAQ